MMTSLLSAQDAADLALLQRQGWVTVRQLAAAEGQLHAITFWHEGQPVGPFDCVFDESARLAQGGETNGARVRQVDLTLVGLAELDAVTVGDTFTGGGLVGVIHDKRVRAPERAELAATQVRGAP